MAPKNVLVLLAHNDDEFFVLDSMINELACGNQVYVCYLTYGQINGTPHQTRHDESLRALQTIGIKEEHIVSIGHQEKIFDSDLENHFLTAYHALVSFYKKTNIEKLHTLAWEGGHSDHDSVNILSYCLAKKWRIESSVYEHPGYNANSKIPFYFKIMSFPEADDQVTERPLSFMRAIKLLSFIRFYRSQRRTFVGLLPGILYQFFVKRSLAIKVSRSGELLKRPHRGPLLYESRFGKDFNSFTTKVSNAFKESQL